MFHQPARGGGGAQTLGYTTDNGVTWQHGPRGANAAILAIDTRSGMAVFGGFGTEIFRRTDTSAPWSAATRWATLPSSVYAIIGNDDGTRFWAATRDGILYRSRDGGESWESAGATPGVVRLNRLSASHHDPNGVFFVNDSGELWYFRDASGEAPVQIP